MISALKLPDISTSAAFWAAIATLWSAAGAWFTFVATAYNTRRETYQGIQNLLVGLNAELSFIKEWASGDEGDPGYVLPRDIRALTKARPEWFNPSRYIFGFETPTLQDFTLSPYVRHLTPVVQPLVRLNYSFHRLHDLHADYRAFANGNPSLYASVFKKLTEQANEPSAEECDYMNVVFDLNLRMHRDLIGGEKSTNELCLYKAYRSAKNALEQFETRLRPEPLPTVVLGTSYFCGLPDIRWGVASIALVFGHLTSHLPNLSAVSFVAQVIHGFRQTLLRGSW